MMTNYLKGKYRRSKKEIRIFLFIDLKSSTSILEKLGNDMYYSFLNDAIFDMSSAIVETKAEIYHYVGDEIVFSAATRSIVEVLGSVTRTHERLFGTALKVQVQLVGPDELRVKKDVLPPGFSEEILELFSYPIIKVENEPIAHWVKLMTEGKASELNKMFGRFQEGVDVTFKTPSGPREVVLKPIEGS
jgi:hypothetical protein